ncbi:hypothetical protein LTS14_007488 [Recurvomyces mirabilis]|uniref:uncharacterized protein n=1 Tax=Recurvomyces mirabilis TaxID=574656 RepID=UPI002DDFC0EB|nr:hypothetical protein LTS14_007488 [Recurvomyces mirabilis]
MSLPGKIRRARPASGLSSLPSLSSHHVGTRYAATSDKTARIHVARSDINGGNTATITISNPSKLNIVNIELLQDLADQCQELSKDTSLRVVILTGGPTNEGKAPSFIGGMDIAEMHQLSSPAAARELITHVHKACKALRDLPVPVIARVDGFCLGAGLEIMAACDLRICTEGSTFGMPEVKIGIPSVVEAALLPSLIGIGRTRRLLYLAENIDAPKAERWGLVESVVRSKSELDDAVADWSGKIAQMGPLAIRSQKRLMQKWENCTVDEGVQAGVEAFAEAFEDGGEEPRQLMARFVNRRR